MAVDKLVDSTQLDSDLASVANAIRAKSGGSSQLAFPSGFVSEIGNIPSGGGGLPELDAISFNASGATLGDDVVFDFGNADANLSDFLRNTKFSKSGITVEVKCGSINNLYRGLAASNVSTNLYTVIFSPTTKYTEGSSWLEFTRSTKASRILGKPLLITSFGTGNNKTFYSTNITEVYVAPNRITSGGAGISTGTLVDASIVSFANGLKAGLATPQTLTISNAATKAKCSTILGTVSQITEDEMTFDFFTQDANGTVTLADFITNTKGWTLA